MVRPVRVLPLLAVLAAVAVALVAPGRASARVTPLGEYFQVVVLDRISDATFASLAERGAVGLLRPSYGPTTNRRRALAELVRGAEVNARLGGGARCGAGATSGWSSRPASPRSRARPASRSCSSSGRRRSPNGERLVSGVASVRMLS